MTAPPSPPPAADGTRTSATWPIVVALALTIVGQLLLEGRHLLGLLPAAAALVLWARTEVSFQTFRAPATPIVLAAAALLVAAHLWGLDHFPPGLFFDEAVNIREGAALTRPFQLQTWSYELSGRPTLFLYACGLAYHLLGQLWMAPRFLVVIVNIATVAAMAWALVPAIGRRPAAVAAVIFGASAYHLLFARIVYEASVSTFFFLVAVGAALRALRERRFRWWVVWGLALGTGLWTYNAFRLVPVFFVLILGGWALAAPGRWRPLAARVAVGGAVALLIASPLVSIVAENFSDFTFRAAELSVVNEAREANSWRPILRNLVAYPLMYFTNSGTSNQIYQWPAFSPPTAILLWAGLGVAVGAAIRRRGFALVLLLWLAAGLVPGLLTLSIEAPHWCRTLYTLPAASVLATLGLAATARIGHRRQAPMAAALLLVVVAGELWAFTTRIVDDHDVYNFFYPRVSKAAIIARERAASGFEVQASDEFATEAYEEYVFWTIVGDRKDHVQRVRLWESLPRNQCRPPVTMLIALRDERLVAPLSALYPGSSLTVYRDPLQQPIARELELACEAPPPGDDANAVLIRHSGEYTVESEVSAELRIEGRALHAGDRIVLPAGLWAVECSPPSGAGIVLSGPEPVILERSLFAVAAPGHGLSATYIDNDGSIHRQLDRLVFVNQRGHLQPYFEIEWRGRLAVPESGTYEFQVSADDFGELVIGGRTILRYPYDEGYYHGVASLDLEAGEHPLRIDFAKRKGGLTFDITWKPPWARDFDSIEPSYLVPAEGPQVVPPRN